MGVVHEPQEDECKVACPNVGVFWHSVCDTLQGPVLLRRAQLLMWRLCGRGQQGGQKQEQRQVYSFCTRSATFEGLLAFTGIFHLTTSVW